MEASMTPGHRQWKKSILTGGALCAAWWPFPPFIWNSNTSLGLNLFILIWTIPLGLNVISAIPPFIYSVGPGNHFMLLDPDVFFALFFVAGNFRSDFSCHPFLFRLICLFIFKMGRRPLCPDGDKKKKKKKEKKSSEMDKDKDKDVLKFKQHDLVKTNRVDRNTSYPPSQIEEYCLLWSSETDI